MSTTIESLELEIKSNSASAESGITALIGSLEKLKTATKGGLGLGSIAKNIGSIATAVNNISSGSADKVTGIANAIKLLGETKVSSTIGKNIASISTAINGLKIEGAGDAMKIQELVTALEPLSQLPKQNLSSFVTPLKKIPEVFTELNKMDMGSFKTKILEVADAVRPLATEMDKVAAGFSSFPTKIQKVISGTEKLAKSTKKAGTSFLEFGAKITVGIMAIKRGISTIGSFITKSSNYTENLHLFNVAMGDYASEAKSYAEQVGEVMGIDPGEWMYNQGLFQTLVTGFGVAGDSVSKMSKNLTQLAYDLSSFYNIDVGTAMQKLKSGMAGELEPLRAIGYDLSQAKLEATAAELGIDKAVSSMTQAEKAMVRYYAIMNQVTFTHGDMAETIMQPANQLRILKAQLGMLGREIGNVFMPLLQAVLPYLIAATKVLREIVSAIATLVGYKPTDDITENLTSGTESATESLEDATDAAKKLKSYMMGFDELNIINPNNETVEDTSAFDIELPDYSNTFMDKLTDEGPFGEIVRKMKEWLGITEEIDEWSDLFETKLGRILTAVGLIAGGMLLWKLSITLIKQLDNISIGLGAILLIDSIMCTIAEGLSWESVIGGALGGALMGAGIGFKLGGVQGAIGGLIIGIGLSLVINGITSMIGEGVNVENVVTTIAGVLTTIGGLVVAVKLFNKNNKMPSTDFNTASDTISEVSTGTSTLTTKLKTLATNLAWGLVIIAEVAAAALLIVGAIAILGWELEQVGKAWEPVIENGGTVATAMGIGTGVLVLIGGAAALLGTLGKTVATDVGIGVLILAEVGAAAILFTAEILVIGKLLDEVGKAWEPVLENGETIKKAIARGTALLVAIGVVCAALGVASVASAGALPLAIGLGTAILLELGIATGLFITEIVEIGKLLDEVGKAWKPVLDIGEDISDAIAKGTELLISVGIVAAALGVAAVASVGLLPLAIGLGTEMLKQLTKAFIVFTDNIIIVANQLREELHPALDKASEILPDVTTNMSTYTDFMGDFAREVVSYSANTAIAGIASTIGKIIGFFTGDPVKRMTTEVRSQNNQFDDLIDELEEAIPKIWKAIDLQNEYNEAMSEYARAQGQSVFGGIGSFLGGVWDGITSAFSGRSIDTSATVSVATVPTYATGGFPESGQAFIARENGIPEMVGTIGRRTAVANNEQIVESVASGVAEANSEQNMLLREQNTLLRALLEKDSGVYLDGRSLSASVDKYKREQGRVLITGGAL